METVGQMGIRVGATVLSITYYPNLHALTHLKMESQNYNEKEKSSLMSEFNRPQREQGKPEVKSGSIVRSRLKKHKPKHALCPHMTDYCDTCKELNVNEKASSWVRKCSIKWYTPNRNIAKTETQKQVHKEDAFKAREFIIQWLRGVKVCGKRLLSLSRKVSLSEADTDQLEALKHQFTLVISADYQQAKLLPH